jgi:hypothetical protein
MSVYLLKIILEQTGFLHVPEITELVDEQLSSAQYGTAAPDKAISLRLASVSGVSTCIDCGQSC